MEAANRSKSSTNTRAPPDGQRIVPVPDHGRERSDHEHKPSGGAEGLPLPSIEQERSEHYSVLETVVVVIDFLNYIRLFILFKKE